MRKTVFVAVTSLLLGATAAETGQGWYLLRPQINRPGEALDLSPPLALWTQVGAYDTAKECEAWKDGLIRQAEALPDSEPRKKAALEWTRAFRCIASDDPRLREGK